MKKSLIRISLLLLLIIPISILQAQIQKGEIFKGKSKTSLINPTENHHYNINLEKHQFVFFRLKQNGVDLKISTYNPEGEKIAALFTARLYEEGAANKIVVTSEKTISKWKINRM